MQLAAVFWHSPVPLAAQFFSCAGTGTGFSDTQYFFLYFEIYISILLMNASELIKVLVLQIASFIRIFSYL